MCIEIEVARDDWAQKSLVTLRWNRRCLEQYLWHWVSRRVQCLKVQHYCVMDLFISNNWDNLRGFTLLSTIDVCLLLIIVPLETWHNSFGTRRWLSRFKVVLASFQLTLALFGAYFMLPACVFCSCSILHTVEKIGCLSIFMAVVGQLFQWAGQGRDSQALTCLCSQFGFVNRININR